MNPQKKILVALAILTPVAAIITLWPETPPATGETATHPRQPAARPSQPQPAMEILTAEDSASVPHKRLREPVLPKPAHPATAMAEMSDEAFAAMIERMEKIPRQRIDRDILALKKAIPSLTAEQESRIRAALEAALPKISRAGEGAGIQITGGSGASSIDSPQIKDLLAGLLDPAQLQSYNELLDARKRSQDEALATSRYSRALGLLPDLTEDQKTALHSYYMNHSGQPAPSPDQQREELAKFLKPDEIETLGDSQPQNMPQEMIFSSGDGPSGMISISSGSIAVPAVIAPAPEKK